MGENELLGGAAQVGTNPPLGTPLAGLVGVHTGAQSVLNSLDARPLVLAESERKLGISMNSPMRHRYVVHALSHYAGYIPTREAFARGGHEAATTSWSELVPDAQDRICVTAVELLADRSNRHSRGTGHSGGNDGHRAASGSPYTVE